MHPYTIRCTNCAGTRVARKTPDGIEPIRETCPDCGCREYETLA